MTTRHRLTAVVAALALCGVVAGVGVASASQVGVTASSISSSTVGHPCPGTAAVTAATGTGVTYSGVSVTVPAGCAGLQLNVRMTSGATTLTGTATVAASGATVVSFAPTTYSALSSWTVTAAVGGWNLPATWSFTPPAYWCTVVTAGSTATCTVTVTRFYGTKNGGSGPANYYDVVVTTTSTAYVQWEVGFYLDNAFYGTRPTELGNSGLDGYNDGGTNWNGTNNAVTPQSACSVIPMLTVRGNNTGGANNFQSVKNNRVRQFSLVVGQGAAGYDDVLAQGCTA